MRGGARGGRDLVPELEQPRSGVYQRHPARPVVCAHPSTVRDARRVGIGELTYFADPSARRTPSATAAASARPRTPSFDRTRATWCSTVLRETNRRVAISGFDRPSPSRAKRLLLALGEPPELPRRRSGRPHAEGAQQGGRFVGVAGRPQVLEDCRRAAGVGGGHRRRGGGQDAGELEARLRSPVGDLGSGERCDRGSELGAGAAKVSRRKGVAEQPVTVRGDHRAAVALAELDQRRRSRRRPLVVTRRDLTAPEKLDHRRHVQARCRDCVQRASQHRHSRRGLALS